MNNYDDVPPYLMDGVEDTDSSILPDDDVSIEDVVEEIHKDDEEDADLPTDREDEVNLDEEEDDEDEEDIDEDEEDPSDED